jgi:hypothetical protein
MSAVRSAVLVAAFAHAQAPAPDVKMNATPTNIVQRLIATQKTVPALAGLTTAHFKENLLQFERGRSRVPNQQYEEQMTAWRAKSEARTQPDKMRMKRHAPRRPTKDRIEWSEDGVSIWMEFAVREPVDPLVIRAAVHIPVQGYEAIALTWVANEYVAQLADLKITLFVDGPMRAVTEQAVFDLLLYYQDNHKAR